MFKNIYIRMYIHSVHLRKKIGKLSQRNVCCPFVSHTYTLEPSQLHIRARPKSVSCVRLHCSILSIETKSNGGKLSYTATRLLRPTVIVSYIFDIYHGQIILTKKKDKIWIYFLESEKTKFVRRTSKFH